MVLILIFINNKVTTFIITYIFDWISLRYFNRLSNFVTIEKKCNSFSDHIVIYTNVIPSSFNNSLINLDSKLILNLHLNKLTY